MSQKALLHYQNFDSVENQLIKNTHISGPPRKACMRPHTNSLGIYPEEPENSLADYRVQCA